MSCKKVVPVFANPIIAKSSDGSFLLLFVIMDVGAATDADALLVLLPPMKIERT